MIKRFCDWIRLKVKLDSLKIKAPHFKEGEIWWCYVGENVGHEQNGKGENFTRPVYILKKYNSETFLGLPTSSKGKKGTWYQLINCGNTVLLAQGKTFDYRRLHKKMNEVHTVQKEAVKKAYIKLHS